MASIIYEVIDEIDDGKRKNPEKLCEFPPNAEGSAPVFIDDLSTLEREKFLNDGIIGKVSNTIILLFLFNELPPQISM